MRDGGIRPRPSRRTRSLGSMCRPRAAMDGSQTSLPASLCSLLTTEYAIPPNMEQSAPNGSIPISSASRLPCGAMCRDDAPLIQLLQQMAHEFFVEFGGHGGGHVGMVTDGIVFHDIGADDRRLDARNQSQHIARAEAARLVMRDARRERGIERV